MTTLKHPGTTPRAIGDGVPRSGWHLFFHPFLEYMILPFRERKRRPGGLERGSVFGRGSRRLVLSDISRRLPLYRFAVAFQSSTDRNTMLRHLHSRKGLSFFAKNARHVLLDCFFADIKLFFLWLMLFNQALWDFLGVVCS